MVFGRSLAPDATSRPLMQVRGARYTDSLFVWSSLGYRVGSLLVALCALVPVWSGCSFPKYELLDESSSDSQALCTDRQKNEYESDTDCGGICSPCGMGQACLVAADCASGVCLLGTCAAPSCTDGVRNGRESDVDCGEACIPSRCASGDHCTNDEDCSSFRCRDGACEVATCSDGLRNGAESDLDCGGPSCAPCATGLSCGADQDCATRVCSAARCAPDSCRDQRVDPGETDIDCGGSLCGPCRGGSACVLHADCMSGTCLGGTCSAASCTDGVLNQAETDVDCGGSGCPACPAAAACMMGANCQSGVCAQQRCAEPTCSDFVQNGTEMSVDCGGACPACATGAACTLGTDCVSGVCLAETCAPARCDDGVKNGSESDVDCGQGCKPCALGKLCSAQDDCASGKCDKTCAPTVRVELLSGNREATPICIQPCFHLVNDGPNAVPLSSLSIRYYYTKELAGDESYGCYWVNTGDCNQIAPPGFTNMNPKRPGADRYVELGFTDAAKPIASGKDFVLQGGFCMPDGKRFNQADDYSYAPNDSYKATSKVVLFENGVRIWGDLP